MYGHLKTLIEVLYFAKENYGDKDFLQYKENDDFVGISYNDFTDRAETMAAALYERGLRRGDKATIISDNHYRWLVADMGILSLGAADVPRGSDAVEKEIQYIMEHSESKICFAENPQVAGMILSFIKKLPTVKTLVLFYGDVEEIKDQAPSNLNLTTYDSLMDEGKKLRQKHAAELVKLRSQVKEDDLATLIYTSGTTGTPKGVMLLHKNIMHNLKSLPALFDVGPKDRWLSVLPVWHVYERTVEYCVLITGGSMAYSKPTARHLVPDLQTVRPTFMVSVPRIWEALYSGIVNKLQKDSATKYNLLLFFSKIGKAFIIAQKTLTGQMPIFRRESLITSFFKRVASFLKLILLYLPYQIGDLILFSKIRAKTGNALKVPISGGGALPEHIDYFFAMLKIEIFEGYGITETAPIISVRNFQHHSPRTVGKPPSTVEVKIGDEKGNPLPSQQEKGIIYVKGDLVMKGYYKEPEKTKKVLSSDGWFNTGDLGRLTLKGEIQITGRAKDTIVLIGGENIEPGPIENKLTADRMISQCIVVGQDQKVLGALIIPDEELLTTYAEEHDIPYTSYEELCDKEEVRDHFNKIIKSQVNIKNGFKSYERISFFDLLPQPFEVGKELTNTLKMKRNFIHEEYADRIKKLYQ